MHLLFVFFLLAFPLYGSDIRLGAEAEPVSVVADCVNVVTGEFFLADTDLVLEGPAPLQFTRLFDSGCSYHSWLGHHWGSHLPLSIDVYRDSDDHTYRAEIPVREGASYPFKDQRYQEKFLEMHLDTAIFNHGITNLSQDGISGQHNIKNFRVFFDSSKYEVLLGDGTRRNYENKGKGKHRLKEEYLPNTQKVEYSYVSDSLKRIQVKNRAGNRVLNHINIAQEEDTVQLRGRNGYKATYYLEEMKYKIHDGLFDGKSKRTVLSRVKRTGKPDVQYYHNNHTVDKYGKYQIGRVEYPNKRYLEVSYEHHGKDVFKVAELRAPVGFNAYPVVTHNFSYHREHDFHYADVKEPYDKLTRYIYHGETKRLHRIDHYKEGRKLHHTERFVWEEKSDLEKRRCGWLKFKGFGRGSELTKGTELVYDDAGNVTREILWGNLSGKGKKTFHIHGNGTWDRDTESYCIERTFTQDGFNLLLSEKRPEGLEIRYEYLPGTNLLTAQKTLAHGKIEKRVFHTYNDDGFLIKTVQDDGSSEEVESFQDVMVRTLTEFHLVGEDNAAFGKNREIIIYACEGNKGTLLKRSVFHYDAAGRVVKEDIYDNQNIFQYALETTYDKEGRIIQQTNPLGQVVRYAYDDNFNKTEEEWVGTGLTTQYLYDFSNRLVQQKEIHTDGPTLCTWNLYNYLSHRTVTEDSYGNQTTYDHTVWGQEIEQRQPLVFSPKGNINPTIKKAYDRCGNLYSLTDAEGNKTTYSYNARGQVKSTSYPDGTKETCEYNLNGTLATKTDRLGTSTHYEYDPLGHCIKESTILKESHFVYKGDLLLAEIDPMGYRTEYTYDPAGRKISETRNGITTRFEYDHLGRLGKVCHPEQILVTVYDYLNRLVEERTESPQGDTLRKIAYQYDNLGNRTHVLTYYSEIEYAIHLTQYNSYSLPYYERDPLGNETHYTYDFNHINPLNQKVLKKTTTLPNGSLVIEVMDALGRLSTREEQTPLNYIINYCSYLYDAHGNQCLQSSWRYANGTFLGEHKIERQYDSMQRLIILKEQQRTQATYTYNELGHIKNWQKPDGVQLNYLYDSLGRLIEQSSTNGTIHYKYSYDANDRLLNVDDLVTNTCTTRVYDPLGRIVHETLGNKLALDFTYDKLGRVCHCQAPEVQIAYTYDAVQLLTATRQDSHGSPLYTHTYLETDLRGRQKRAQLIGSTGELTCSYDLLGRYTQLSTPGWTHNISYDCMGNPTILSGIDTQGKYHTRIKYDWQNQVLQDGLTFYTYDTLQNRISKNNFPYSINEYNQLIDPNFEYNANGSLCRIGDQSFTYDALERLIQVKTNEGTFIYTYDSFGRRLTRTNSLGETEKYLYHNDREIGAYENNILRHFDFSDVVQQEA